MQRKCAAFAHLTDKTVFLPWWIIITEFYQLFLTCTSYLFSLYFSFTNTAAVSHNNDTTDLNLSTECSSSSCYLLIGKEKPEM